MEGYVKLHRQLLDSTQFADPIRLKIWIWCLIKANHKKRAVPLKIGKGYSTVMVNRGQFIFGRNKASEELDIPGSTVLRHLEKMVSEKALLIQSNNQYSIITICKYEDYQSIEESSEQVTDNQRTSNGQVTDTNKNDNNVNKELVLNVSFEKFWNLYEKKVGDIQKIKSMWLKLKDKDRLDIMDYIPKYKTSQPNKKYRKDPKTFLGNNSWLDEIIEDDLFSPKKFTKQLELATGDDLPPD